MFGTITYRVDTSELLKLAESFRKGPQATKLAITRTMNRSVEAGAVVVRKELTKVTGIKASDTRRSRGVTIERATNAKQTAAVVARGKYTPLSYFNPRQGDDGVLASPWARQRVFARTFMLTFSSGHTGVYKRDKTRPRRTFRPRGGRKPYQAYELVELWGPNIAPEMYRNDIPQMFQARVMQAYATRLPTEIEFALSKIKPKGVKR